MSCRICNNEGEIELRKELIQLQEQYLECLRLAHVLGRLLEGAKITIPPANREALRERREQLTQLSLQVLRKREEEARTKLRAHLYDDNRIRELGGEPNWKRDEVKEKLSAELDACTSSLSKFKLE